MRAAFPFSFRDVLDAMNRPGPLIRQRTLKHCHALVNLLRHELSIVASRTSRRTEDLEHLVSSIRRSPHEPWPRERLARELHLSISQLTRQFQKTFGVSPVNFVIQQRMMIATQLLLNTDHTIEAVANEVGYESVYSFTRLFIRVIVISPGKYRRRFGQR